MSKLDFPLLKADDIEVRVGTVAKDGSGFSLLLYKTARTDAKYLDQVVFAYNWQTKYYVLGDSLFCAIGIYNEERNEWIWKDDCGSETQVEKEKGQSSDAFKRAGFRWGIGRELYSAPFIYIKCDDNNNTKTKYEVKSISYNDKREIETLEIKNGKGEIVYSYGLKKKPAENKPKTPEKKEVGGFVDLHSEDKITKDQLDKILLYMVSLGEERKNKFKNWLEKSYGSSDLNTLNQKQANEIIATCHIGEKQ